MPTLFLTDPFIRSLRPMSDKEAAYRDRNVCGLALRVTAGGGKSWSVHYRVNGRQRRMTLGKYGVIGLADARQRARVILSRATMGEDPPAAKQQALHAETFADLANKEQARDRVLSEDEIRAVWSALGEEQPMMAGLIRLRLLTAQRGGEILGARWEEFDLASGWWTIPASRSKNKLSSRALVTASAANREGVARAQDGVGVGSSESGQEAPPRSSRAEGI